MAGLRKKNVRAFFYKFIFLQWKKYKVGIVNIDLVKRKTIGAT